jgi:hypothetical protein
MAPGELGPGSSPSFGVEDSAKTTRVTPADFGVADNAGYAELAHLFFLLKKKTSRHSTCNKNLSRCSCPLGVCHILGSLRIKR